jgi:hypothetical protein
MRAWLSPWGVHLRAEVPVHLAGLAALGRGELRCRQLLGGYAYLLTFRTTRSVGSAGNGHAQDGWRIRQPAAECEARSASARSAAQK